MPKFETTKELHEYLLKNQDEFIYQKKNAYKETDSCSSDVIMLKENLTDKDFTSKSSDSAIKVRAIINTTMIMDSHKDVHINGIWKKTISENKRIKHVREHKDGFENIIADKEDLKVFTKLYTWKDLGLDKEGTTEALVFDSVVKKERNSFMYKQYKENNVDNHSVGMYYVNVKFALNDSGDEYAALKAEYDKHINNIVNKEEVAKLGYFWAIYEAKLKEGSAVTDGSNPITPVLQPKFKSEDVIADKNVLAIKTFLNMK